MERSAASDLPLLPETERELAQTATLGGAILSALNVQRRVIEGAVRRHDAVAEELGDSENTMRRMNKKLLMRRLWYFSIIALLIAAIVFVWWLKSDGGGLAQHSDPSSRL